MRLVKVSILLPINGDQRHFGSSGMTEALAMLAAHSSCLPYLYPTYEGHNGGYLAVGLAWQSGHRALVLNNVHAVPCEVMYIAFH